MIRIMGEQGGHDTTNIAEPIRHLAVPIGSVHPYPGNPRTHDLPAIAASLANPKRGQYKPITVNRRTGDILAGNGTWEAARDTLGWTRIAVTWVDVDDATAAGIVAVDNRTSDLAGYDDRLLADLLGQVDDLASVGYTTDDLDAILRGLDGDGETGEGNTDPDDVPEPPAGEPVTKPGDLWLCGPHRLKCGSATKRDEVRALLGDARPDIMVTDPPYGVAVGGDKSKGSIHGDLTQAVIPVSFLLAVEHLADDARIYLFGGSANWGMYAGLFDVHLRMQVRPIVWVKEAFVLRPNNYHSQFEMVYFGWKGNGGAAKHWYGDRTTSDVWQVRRDSDRMHPTQKPVEVCEIPIKNSCPPNGLVYEPFGGSGSTLIAAERLGRRCYAIELDPKYCDVILRRWQDFSGSEPVHAETGEKTDFTATRSS